MAGEGVCPAPLLNLAFEQLEFTYFYSVDFLARIYTWTFLKHIPPLSLFSYCQLPPESLFL